MQIMTSLAGLDALSLWMSILLCLLSLAALAAFIQIQLWLNDPQHRAFNDAWFARFEAHVYQAYNKGGIGWRAKDLNSHFDRSVIT